MQQQVDCPICGCSTAHVNNHVRMSNGDGHGSTQTYPDGWDRDREAFEDGHFQADDRDDEQSGDLAIEDDDGSDEQGAVPISIEDRPSDMREYDCHECEASVEYTAAECPNGHEQVWYATG